MARFYTNENFLLPVVVELRQLGHDVLTAREAGNANRRIPDDQVVSFANSVGRVILTLNRRHFVREHTRSQAHAGIIVCTSDMDFISQATRIDATVHAYESFTRKLIRVNRE